MGADTLLTIELPCAGATRNGESRATTAPDSIAACHWSIGRCSARAFSSPRAARARSPRRSLDERRDRPIEGGEHLEPLGGHRAADCAGRAPSRGALPRRRPHRRRGAGTALAGITMTIAAWIAAATANAGCDRRRPCHHEARRQGECELPPPDARDEHDELRDEDADDHADHGLEHAPRRASRTSPRPGRRSRPGAAPRGRAHRAREGEGGGRGDDDLRDRTGRIAHPVEPAAHRRTPAPPDGHRTCVHGGFRWALGYAHAARSAAGARAAADAAQRRCARIGHDHLLRGGDVAVRCP